jgi:hypothetical protein
MFLMPPRAAMRRRESRVFRAEKRLIEIAPRHPTVDFLLCRLPAAARGPNPEKTEFRTPNSEPQTPNPKPQTPNPPATIDHRCRDRMAIAGRSPVPRLVPSVNSVTSVRISGTRDITAAKAFFRKAFRRHGDPRVITLDGSEPTHAALRRIGMNNE